MTFKILVVDDEKNIREGLAEYLHSDGYDVICAENGDEGWLLFNKGDIDLIITDLKMPGLSGEELMKKVQVVSPGFPVIKLKSSSPVAVAPIAILISSIDLPAGALNPKNTLLLLASEFPELADPVRTAVV